VPNVPGQGDGEALAAINGLIAAPKADASLEHPEHLVFPRMRMKVDAAIRLQN
jgi:hypothetical protein